MSLSDYTKTVSRQGRVDISNLNIQFGTGKQTFTALHNLSMFAKPGEFVCLLGSSGCGKSTLLAALAGHIQANGGSILVDGQQINGPHPERGLVFQQHTLFPWKKIIDNIAFGLKMKGISRATRHEQARELLKLMGLAGFENHYPAQLSGGMLQRVEIARVLINSPKVMLMDEPFGAVDPLTRTRLQAQFVQIQRQLHKCVILVTHDLDEAIRLADRIAVMASGKLVQYDTPEAILSRPANKFVHDFVGTDRALKRISRITIDRFINPAPSILSGVSDGL